MQYLEYVQPTGNRQTYTNTGIYVDDTEFEFQFDYLYFAKQEGAGGAAGWSELIGTGYPSKFRVGSNPNIFMMYGGNALTTSEASIEGQVTINKTGLYLDGVKLISYTASTPNGDYLAIGGDYQYPTDALVDPNTKIGRFKVYHNNVLVGDFVPAIDNNVVGFYDEVGQVFYDSDGSQPWIAGPVLSSIVINPTSSSVKATGGTIEVAISTENSWVANPTDGSWYTLSESGGTGNTAITITIPSYTGATARQDTIDFVDTNTTDEMTFTIKQKKYSSGQPFYLGGDEITEIYLGEDAISEAYLGEDLVFSTGPFVGLKVSPKTIAFNTDNLTASLKVKSSEQWSLTTPAWVSADISTGDTGETIVSLTATSQTAATSGSVVVSSANYSAEVTTNYSLIVIGGYLQISGPANFVTDFNAGVEYYKNNYLRLEINADYTANGYMYDGRGGSSSWFTYEKGGWGQYFNFGNKTGAIGGQNTSGYNSTLVVTLNNGNITNSMGQTGSFGGTIPSANLIFCASGSADSIGLDFYRFKVYNDINTLAYDFIAGELEGNPLIYDVVSGNIYYPSGGSVTYIP